MALNQQTLDRFWNEIRTQLRRRWDELAQEDLQRVRGNLDQLLGFVQQKTGASREQVRRYLEDLTANLRRSMDQTATRTREGFRETRQTTDESLQRASDALRAGYIQTGRVVRSRPVESVALSFAAGLLGGMLLASVLRSR